MDWTTYAKEVMVANGLPNINMKLCDFYAAIAALSLFIQLNIAPLRQNTEDMIFSNSLESLVPHMIYLQSLA